MYEAMKNKDLEAVKQLLKEDPKPSSLKYDNSHGYTPLHWAAIHGNAEIVEYLLDKGAKVNKRANSDYTPLHLAIDLNNDPEIVKVLIKHGANVNAQGGTGPMGGV